MNPILFDEKVTAKDSKDKNIKWEVQVRNDCGILEVRIAPVDAAYQDGMIAKFDDREQFERFVEKINNIFKWK